MTTCTKVSGLKNPVFTAKNQIFPKPKDFSDCNRFFWLFPNSFTVAHSVYDFHTVPLKYIPLILSPTFFLVTSPPHIIHNSAFLILNPPLFRIPNSAFSNSQFPFIPHFPLRCFYFQFTVKSYHYD